MMDTIHDSTCIVWKVTFLDGSSCHYGVKSTAQAAARGCGIVEAIKLKDKRFRLVETGSAEPTVNESFTVRGSAGKVGERNAFEKWAQSFDLNIALCKYSGEGVYSDCNTDYAWQAWQARALLAAKGGE